MAKLKIKRGDSVIVIAGKDKGKKGKIVSTDLKNNKVVIEGVNVVTRAKKPKSAQDKGGLIKKNAPVDASNVMLVCPTCGKPSRTGIKEVNNQKVRYCKKCKAEFAKQAVKTTEKVAVKADKETKKETK